MPTFVSLRDYIYERTGLFFPDSKKYVLENRLQARLRERKCGSYEEYFRLLKFDTWRDQELNAVFDLVTTNETFFYRDQAQLQAFLEVVLPSVLEANAGSCRLRLWSAACSTGDEPYTLAIMLLEQPAVANWSIEILASDISESALQAAQSGVYAPYSVRNVPPGLLNRYFRKENGHYVLEDKVKQQVRFTHMNLYDTARMKMVRGMDVIFCRNCLIYFDDKAKQKIIGNLSDALRPGGYFVIGFSESLHGVSNAFTPVYANRSVVYRKV
ncbi:CheR family methyltransferase [Candidatus Nitrospira bockiana]